MECVIIGLWAGWFLFVLYGVPMIADHYDVMTGARGWNVGNTWHTPAFIFGSFAVALAIHWILGLIFF